MGCSSASWTSKLSQSIELLRKRAGVPVPKPYRPQQQGRQQRPPLALNSLHPTKPLAWHFDKGNDLTVSAGPEQQDLSSD